MQVRITAVILSLSVLFSLTLYAGAADKLIGVWELVSRKNLDTGDSSTSPYRLIITKGHWSQTYAAPDRRKINKPVNELTKEELLDRVRGFGAYGTYEVTGNEFKKHRIYQTDPMLHDTKDVREFHFDAGELVFVGDDLGGNKIEWRYKRVE